MQQANANIAAAAAEILAATTQQAASAAEQSAAITQTTTTIEEVKAIAMQTAQQAAQVAHDSQNALGIQVSGGQKTSAMGFAMISNEDFEKALELSLGKAGLFASVSDSANAHYELNAYIGRVSQPLAGFSMTVTLEVSYSLVESQSHRAVWQKNISSTHTASAGEAFVGTTRLRIATEGAAKQNIEYLLRELSQLTLD